MNNFGNGAVLTPVKLERFPVEDVIAHQGLGYGLANAAVSSPPRSHIITSRMATKSSGINEAGYQGRWYQKRKVKSVVDMVGYYRSASGMCLWLPYL